jgi:hypothetical protein
MGGMAWRCGGCCLNRCSQRPELDQLPYYKLSWLTFHSRRVVVLEQVLGLEPLAEEYAQVSKEELSHDTKLSVLLRLVPNR